MIIRMGKEETDRRDLTAMIQAERDTYDKMIFVSGPRQVGKTTLLKQLARGAPGPILNWDNLRDRAMLSKTPYALFESEPNVYLDEIHKYPRWKNLLKGAFDSFGDRCKITVTGSARLDVYRRGGDSLVGRYLLFHLHPFTLGEMLRPGRVPAELSIEEILAPNMNGLTEASHAWDALERYGGFPEPLFAQSDRRTRQWRSMRHERLVREDIRDMTRIRELALMEQMVMLLPERCGNPLSLNQLRTTLEVSHDSVRTWLSTLEQFYYVYFVPPYAKSISRAIKKERKLYLWDWSEVPDEGVRFENMVASHLLRWTTSWREMGYGNYELNFVRNKDGEEVDFLVVKDRRPWLLIEAKVSDTRPAPTLLKFAALLGPQNAPLPCVQLTRQETAARPRIIDKVRWHCFSAARFFKTLA